MEETIRVHKSYDYTENATLNAICTSFFLYACYNTLEIHDKAWFYVREAATLIHLGQLNKEETYLRFDNVEASRRRRLYWLLLVTERFVDPALLTIRPEVLVLTGGNPGPTLCNVTGR